MARLAIVTTHPIQYQAPWFRALAAHPDIDLEVLFCHQANAKDQSSAGFGVAFDWDIPLLDGYKYRFLSNVAKAPSLDGFKDVDTPEIRHIIRDEKFDAVLVSGWHYKSAWQAIYACWKYQTPVMMRGDSHLHTQRHPLKKAVKTLLHGRFIPRFNACLAVGKWSRDYYLHYGAKPDKVFFVPHIIDETLFTTDDTDNQGHVNTLRQQWDLLQDAVVFVFVGKLIDKKRPLDFIHAIAVASQTNAKIQGLIVGDGPLRAECEAQILARQAPAHFAGFLNQSQIIEAYRAADTLVLPSDGGETWGLVVNEAMACGCSALVSDQVGCGPDLIVAGQTGAIFPCGDVEALSQLMLRLASDRLALLQMGANARKHLERYSTQAAVQGVLEALKAVK